MAIENFFIFGLSAFFLIVSGIYLVKSFSRIISMLGISEFNAAFIIMAFATSIPELLVGISSAVQGVSSIGVGNIIGSNIIDITLLLGIFAIAARGITFKSKKVGEETYLMFISIFLIFALYLIGNSLSRIDGIILISFFGFNLARLMKKREKFSKKHKSKIKERKKFSLIVIFLFSLVVLFISSAYVTKSSSLIAIDFGLPEILVGIFLISFATTLPELVFGLNAIFQKHNEMSVGDQTGAVLVKNCLVIGIMAIIRPIHVSLAPFLISGAFMLISGLLVTVFIVTGKKLEVKEGIFLISLYLLFAVLQFLTRSVI